MALIEKSIEVNVPVRTAYNQWTQFEEFLKFMEGVTQSNSWTARTCIGRRRLPARRKNGMRSSPNSGLTNGLPGRVRREPKAW